MMMTMGIKRRNQATAKLLKRSLYFKGFKHTILRLCGTKIIFTFWKNTRGLINESFVNLNITESVHQKTGLNNSVKPFLENKVR